jgi:glyoxylase-like metal-dependent hydrolase (beta-lactamase superfamily II)
MMEGMNRRKFLQIGMAAGAAAAAPRWMKAQAVSLPDRIIQARAAAQNAPITTTKLYDNAYLLANNVGGNMVLQTGKDGNILVDSSFSTCVAKVRASIAQVSHDAPDALINTHWHYDHTDGNEGLHEAGFTIFGHKKTRERMSTPQAIAFFHFTVPASPDGALPTITFDDAMHAWHNGDSLDLAHFDPAHTDTDIYVHFHNADVLHMGDVFFNGMYPFIDESTGGRIDGMIHGAQAGLSVAGENTKIIPGHGPLGTKADLKKYHDMLSAIRDKVAALKAAGANEQEAVAKKPTAEFDAVWAKGFVKPEMFAGLVYRTV